MADDSRDPRDWNREQRAKHLREIGLPLIRPKGRPELSFYRGVVIEWTTTLDDRITNIIDQIAEAGHLDDLERAQAHKGGCWLRWSSSSPPEYAPGNDICVLDADGEPIDCWVIEPWDGDTDPVKVDETGGSYDAYLKSDHWQHMRALAREFYGDRCVLCGATRRLDVHHRTYERKGRERLSDLILLCRKCHGRFHAEAA